MMYPKTLALTNVKTWTLLALMTVGLAGMMTACRADEPEKEQSEQTDPQGEQKDTTLHLMQQIDSLGWYWEQDCPWDMAQATFNVSTEPMRLHFFGWQLDEDTVFTVQFPESTEQYGQAVLTYRMCGWNQGPAEWDMTTMIKIYDRENDEWLEFVRAITPYGGSFDANWEKKFYLDITEFLPLMKGATDFRIFYCGWDATDERAHAVQLTFSFFEGENSYGTPIGYQKIYDSTLPNDGSNGYRAWSYGVAGWSIEDATRLGLRNLDIPEGTTQVILRVCITGHGQDAYNGTGRFPNRKRTKATNCAEFDKNHYTIVLNGQEIATKGYIWEVNEGAGHNYPQAGTYKYNRGGWGPGKPCNVQHWSIDIRPDKWETMWKDATIDFNLEEYISPCTEPNHQYVACYYVMVDAFYFN